MPGRVPLSRRNLLADRRRLAAGAVGVGLAVMLVLLLDGMWVGVQRQGHQTRDRFAAEEATLVKDMSADIMRIMSTVALLIALAVIGLTLFSLTLAKLREHAIVKALGGRNRRVAGVVLAQAAWSVALAVALATVVAVGLGVIIGRVNPAIAVEITPASVIRVGVAALVVGALGAVIPLRRVAAVDPASAFRRAS